MPRLSRKRATRIKNLVIVCTLTAIVLSVSTFAWFIGMRTVNVSSFDVQIASTDSLLLSLNGDDWDTTVNISQADLNTVSYEGHTNRWGGKGLFPMSSVGAMDVAASRMRLFEKSSLTATPGGYRLMASRVNNYQEVDDVLVSEQDGYVVFDLFIKNFSGNQYIKALNPKDEEAIYLTVDSEVNVADDGVKHTGIENSVRVAFGQIGRVIGTTNDPKTITDITCTSSPADGPVTGICRTAQIWEPNDTYHEINAINWYKTSCMKRTGVDVISKQSYNGEFGTCGTVVEGLAYPTYAVSDAIFSNDNVDVYDGQKYNGYTNSNLLVPYQCFTDTDKLLRGTKRPTFMTLEPNSITKVRVYIYIEGQDIDNYDFASIGKKISVKFGFTKERYTEDDIEYEGPDVNQGEGPDDQDPETPVIDRTAPVITLNGDAVITLAHDAAYEELSATVTDNIDAVEDLELITTGTVDPSETGTYKITYSVTDSHGNKATKTRTIIVEAPVEP